MLLAFVTFIVLTMLIWLAWPPRDEARWALFTAMGLAAFWLIFIGWWYGISSDQTTQRWLWLIVLAGAGAPLVHLFVWSAVRLFRRWTGRLQ